MHAESRERVWKRSCSGERGLLESPREGCGEPPKRVTAEHVEEWHSVICAITSNKENVTVAAEISLGHTKQITVILLKAEELHSLLLIIGSSIGGLLLLVVIIAILFKCGFFKRKYQQLNLESIRRAQLKADSLLEEE
ncbi:Integrin alpha-E [Microtus ochrogaster]|uniref:Integrin alpha-E n=1 Tax=Microtus ochrogaster TaxID=79684 RepID=A0A8J6GIK0_MICOH|nr:Integrin alpha-E [Microtus ochrogaster]